MDTGVPRFYYVHPIGVPARPVPSRLTRCLSVLKIIGTGVNRDGIGTNRVTLWSNHLSRYAPVACRFTPVKSRRSPGLYRNSCRCPHCLRFAPGRPGLSRSSPDAITVSHVVAPVLPGFDISHGSPWFAPVVLNILCHREGSPVYPDFSWFATVLSRFVTVRPGLPWFIKPGRNGELNRDSEDIS